MTPRSATTGTRPAVSADAATLPYTWYWSPEAAAAERAGIFGRSWLYAGRIDQLPEVGSFFTTSLAGLPVVVTRAEDGLHALANVCCHRGCEVVLEPQGTRRSLQCHYHAWTYGLDGRLLSAPRSRDEDGFSVDDFRLRPLQLETFGPFLFVNRDENAPSLASFLGDLPAIVAATGVDLGRLRLRDRREYRVRANWKIVVENFLECYHCAVAHPSFADLIDLGNYEITEFEYSSTQRGVPKGVEPQDQDAWPVKEGRYNFLWPTFSLNIYPGSGNVSTNLIVPVSEEETLAVYEFLYEDSVSDAEAAEITGLIHQVMVEDIVLCESVQRGMRSGVFERGRLMLGQEHAIRHFQSLVRAALADQLAVDAERAASS